LGGGSAEKIEDRKKKRVFKSALNGTAKEGGRMGGTALKWVGFCVNSKCCLLSEGQRPPPEVIIFTPLWLLGVSLKNCTQAGNGSADRKHGRWEIKGHGGIKAMCGGCNAAGGTRNDGLGWTHNGLSRVAGKKGRNDEQVCILKEKRF